MRSQRLRAARFAARRCEAKPDWERLFARAGGTNGAPLSRACKAARRYARYSLRPAAIAQRTLTASSMIAPTPVASTP